MMYFGHKRGRSNFGNLGSTFSEFYLVVLHQLFGILVSNFLTFLLAQSTVRKKMATGTFTYNALLVKTLKERIKHKEKL